MDKTLPHTVALEIGAKDEGGGRKRRRGQEPETSKDTTVVIAYYRPPGVPADQTTRFFGHIVKKLTQLEKAGHRTVLVGDSNGDRDGRGRPTSIRGRNNLAGVALVQAEKEAGHTWIKPAGDGPFFTRFDISKDQINGSPLFDPRDATSAVDHASQGRNAVTHRTVTKLVIDDEFQLGADHAGLRLDLRIRQEEGTPLKTRPPMPKRRRLGENEEDTAAYTKSTRSPLSDWNQRVSARLQSLDRLPQVERRRRADKFMNGAIPELQRILSKAADQVGSKKLSTGKASHRTPIRTKSQRCAAHRAMRLTRSRSSTLPERRSAWSKALDENEAEMEVAVREENEEWDRLTQEVDEELERGDWCALWKLLASKKDRPPDMMPKSFTDDKNKHIWKKKEVLQHVADEVGAIAAPGEGSYLSPVDQELTEAVREEVKQIQIEAQSVEDWKPNKGDVLTMIKYLRKAYTGRTAEGPDGTGADMILFADEAMAESLLLMLKLIARAAAAPWIWKNARIVLAHKEGRDPQNLRKSYRPICVGSQLMKAVESIIRVRNEKCLEKKPLHPAIMAYQKGIGHDMAVFTATEAALHAEFTAKGDKPRLYALCIDWENAFNTTDRPLVEWLEWNRFGQGGTPWSISRSISSGAMYRVHIHGHKSPEFWQKNGLGQGPTLSPGKFNISMDPVLRELEESGAGVVVGDELTLGVAWSDDLLLLVREDRLQDVLRAVERVSGKYRKKTKADKVHITPLCQAAGDRPEAKLGGKPVPYADHEKFLGFTLSSSIQGGRQFMDRFRDRADIANSKIERMHVHRSKTINTRTTESVYDSMLLSVISANLTNPQLDTVGRDGKAKLFGYEAARRASANFARRALRTSCRTPPVGLMAELGWPLPDRKIIESKLQLVERLAQRARRQREVPRSQHAGERLTRDSISHTFVTRIDDVSEGDTKGLLAEAKRLYEEAGLGHCWPPRVDQPSQGRRAATVRNIQTAAESVAKKRMDEWIQARHFEDEDTPYHELYDPIPWRIRNGTRNQVGLMTTFRLGSAMTNANRTADGENPSCPCGLDDTPQHVILKCVLLRAERTKLEKRIREIWSPAQWISFEEATNHDKKMHLLGKRMSPRQTDEQRVDLDMAVKIFLEEADETRVHRYGLAPMCGSYFTRPAEATMEQAARWHGMQAEDNQLLRQGCPPEVDIYDDDEEGADRTE